MSASNIIGVQFEPVGKNYFFDASRYPEIQPGDPVVVRTSRGFQLATVSQIHIDTSELNLHSFKSVERPATPTDLLNRKALLIREKETGDLIRDHLTKTGMSAVKVVSVEYSLDGSQLFILISSEASITINLKQLHNGVKGLVDDVKLEIRQIGPRDAAKLIKGMGACGMEKRCCSSFLTEFSSISIRMAKTQDISLTPSEITGMCGRLRCCLMYEYDQYVEAIKTLPKRKRKVITPMGEGRVVQILPLQQAVIVNVPDIGPRRFTKEELERAEKIANGELVEPEIIEEPRITGSISRPEDQTVSNQKRTRNQNHSSKPSRKRGRSSRRSNKHRH